MIEVTIWFGNINGDGAQTYLVKCGDIDDSLFVTAPYRKAVDGALAEFARDQPNACIGQIKIHRTPNRVLEVT